MTSYARTIGAILGSAILFPMAFAAFAYPTVLNQGMTILKPGVQPGIVIFAAPDGVVYAVKRKAKWSRSGPRLSRIPIWLIQDLFPMETC